MAGDSSARRSALVVLAIAMDDAGRTGLARVFGAIDLGAALVVAIGVFAGLPSRWWPIDTGAIVVILLLGAAGAGLIARAKWGALAARIASIVVLVLGLALIATLAVTASYLSGIYGPVGRGGAIILVLVAALALPYLVALPISQLYWLALTRDAVTKRARATQAPTKAAGTKEVEAKDVEAKGASGTPS